MYQVESKRGQSLLERHFAQAGLALELAGQPIVGTDPEVFGMDIQRRRGRRDEYFRIFRGAAGNRVDVLGTDGRLGQLVLLVHEAARDFEVRVSRHTVRADDPRIVRRFGKNGYVIREKTRSQKRHYLCGFDERHLFIGELPRGVSSVRDAHHVLKANEVVQAERTRRVKRQGEWFFVELDGGGWMRLEGALASAIVQHRVPLGFGGNPHVADELVRLREPATRTRTAVEEVYVRGRVRHVDHKTVEFDDWRRVFRNTEPNATSRMPGINWID